MFSNSLLDKKIISVQYTTPTSFGQLTTVYRRNLHIHPTPNQLNIKPPYYRAEYITLQVMALLSTTIRRSNALLRLVLTHPKQRCDAAAVARVGFVLCMPPLLYRLMRWIWPIRSHDVMVSLILCSTCVCGMFVLMGARDVYGSM